MDYENNFFNMEQYDDYNDNAPLTPPRDKNAITNNGSSSSSSSTNNSQQRTTRTYHCRSLRRARQHHHRTTTTTTTPPWSSLPWQLWPSAPLKATRLDP